MGEDRVRVCERGVKEGMDGPPARCEDGSSSGLSRTQQAHPSLAVSQEECLSKTTIAGIRPVLERSSCLNILAYLISAALFVEPFTCLLSSWRMPEWRFSASA